MYEKIAWENFCKTGNIESFLEYKMILELNSNSKEKELLKGDFLSEFDKIEGYSNKGNSI